MLASSETPRWRDVKARPPAPRRILVAGALVIVFLLAASGLTIWQMRQHDIAEAKRELTTLDILLAEESERATQSVDLILTSLRDAMLAEGVSGPGALARTQSGVRTYDLLRSRLAGVPQLDAITVIDATGKLVNFSRFFPIPDVDVSDRDYFTALRDNPRDVAFLSAPVENRGTGTWTIYLARRITGASGEFLGLVLGAMNLGYFEDLYRSLHVGPGGAVSLWRTDGTLLARYPSLPGIGHTFKIQSFSGILRVGEPVVYEVRASIDSRSRIVATVAARQFPIVINVTETFDQVLEDWRDTAALMGAGTALAVLLTLAIVWLLMRQFATYEALAAATAAREQAEEQLRQSQKLEVVGQLTGGIAHDFNNLLTAVLGNLELLLTNVGDEDQRLKRWARNGLEAARRGAMLTQRLLAFSRRQPLDPKTTDVCQLLVSMSDLLRRTLGETVEVETVVAAGLWSAFVDVNQLDSAILNIAINARDAMEGRGRLTIEAANAVLDAAYGAANGDVAPGDYVVISLSDTGKGIAKDVIDKVFEPFFTTKPIGQGTGLGLSQVYGFVKQTGGHIKIYSEVGQGTSVKLYLPRSLDPAATAREAQGDPESLRGRGQRILVVEDDAEVRLYSVETLEQFGYRVDAAQDAAGALAILRDVPDIDLLFTDVGLPGRNGRELATEALRLRPTLKVLFTTGYARNAIVHHGRLDAGVQLITKPFTRAELANKIRLVFGQVEAEAQG